MQPLARKLLHDTLAGLIAERVAEEFRVADAELRFARYQLRIEPIASASVDALVAWVGPTVQRYPTDPNP
jgi:hypothetical protein